MKHLEGGWLEWEHTGPWQGQDKSGLVRQAGFKPSPELSSSKTHSIIHRHLRFCRYNLEFYWASSTHHIKFGSSHICLIIWVLKYPENRSGEWIYNASHDYFGHLHLWELKWCLRGCKIFRKHNRKIHQVTPKTVIRNHQSFWKSWSMTRLL